MSMKHALPALPTVEMPPEVARLLADDPRAWAAEDAPDPGKFTPMLRRGDGGRWLIGSDMDKSNVPVQPVPPRPPQPAGVQTR